MQCYAYEQPQYVMSVTLLQLLAQPNPSTECPLEA